MIVARLAVLEVLLKQHEAGAALCRFEAHQRYAIFVLVADDAPAFIDPSRFCSKSAPTDEHIVA
jgi:hypothetical protein